VLRGPLIVGCVLALDGLLEVDHGYSPSPLQGD
jgi:hypothetical protein